MKVVAVFKNEDVSSSSEGSPGLACVVQRCLQTLRSWAMLQQLLPWRGGSCQDPLLAVPSPHQPHGDLGTCLLFPAAVDKAHPLAASGLSMPGECRCEGAPSLPTLPPLLMETGACSPRGCSSFSFSLHSQCWQMCPRGTAHFSLVKNLPEHLHL